MFLSVLFVLAGALFVSKATLGVFLICVAACFAIWARIYQADKHHRALMALQPPAQVEPPSLYALDDDPRRPARYELG